VKGLAKLEKQFEMKLAEGRVSGGGCGGEKFVQERRAGRTGEIPAAFPHGVARARFAGAAEDGVAADKT